MNFTFKEKIKQLLNFDYDLFGLKIHKRFDQNNKTYDEYIFCLILKDRKKKELIISNGDSHLRDVDFFGAITHFVKVKKSWKVEELFEDENLSIKMDMIQSTNRGFDKVPLWIFKGKSGLGKSFLAHKISNLTVFETDAYKTLPDIINEDIVVLGNKYLHTVDDIVSRVKNRDVIISIFYQEN